MVNENFREFKKHQRDLKQRYIGDVEQATKGIGSDPNYSNPGNTDKSVGATGRDLDKA